MVSQSERDGAVTVYPAGYEFDEVEPDPKMEAEDSDFDKFKTEMHDANDYAKIIVSKKQTDSRGQPIGRNTFTCFECGVEDYTFSQLCTRIRDEYGTGLYKIQGRDSNGKFKFGKTIGIAAPKNADGKETGSDYGILIDKFSDAMEKQQNRTESMFKSLVGPQSGGDAFEQITKMVTAVAGVLGTLGIKLGGNPAPTMADQFKEMMMMKKFMDSFAGDSGAGGDANLYSLLTETMRSFGGPIATAIAAGQDSGDLNAAGLLAAPNPSADLTPQQIAKIDADKVAQEADKAMKANIEILLMNAKSGVDAKQFAQIVVNNTPDDKLDSLYEFLNAEDFLQRLIAMNPEVETFKNWFTVLRDTVIEMLTEPEPGTTIPESEQADSETVAGDIKTGSDISDNDGDTATDTERGSGD